MKGKKQKKLKPLWQNIYRLIFTTLPYKLLIFYQKVFIINTKTAKLSYLGFATFLIHHNSVFLPN